MKEVDTYKRTFARRRNIRNQRQTNAVPW